MEKVGGGRASMVTWASTYIHTLHALMYAYAYMYCAMSGVVTEGPATKGCQGGATAAPVSPRWNAVRLQGQ